VEKPRHSRTLRSKRFSQTERTKTSIYMKRKRIAWPTVVLQATVKTISGAEQEFHILNDETQTDISFLFIC
jgi:hypothetical protein